MALSDEIARRIRSDRSKRHSTVYSREALWQDVLDRAGVDGARHLDADADRREREVRDK